VNLTGEIAVARERLADLLDGHDRLRHTEETLEAPAPPTSCSWTQEEVMKMRMVPLRPTFRSCATVATSPRLRASRRISS
jgi:chemotaxis protein histidine kinase CheA